MGAFWQELGAFFLSFGDPFFRRAALLDLVGGIWETFLQLFPYVVLGSLLGEALKYTSWTKLIYRYTGHSRFWGILTGTVLGILSPLCTYGTIPVLLVLYRGGVSLAPLISFLASSSMMNPQLFVMTVGGLGWEIAFLRLLAVFCFSLLTGLLTLPLPPSFVVREALVRDADTEAEILSRGRKPFAFLPYLQSVGKNLLFVGRMMLLGILLSVLVDMLPLHLLFGEIDTGSPVGVLVAAMAGIPLYACGGGTIPMVASLLSQGLSRGSALAFLTVGPATRITSLSAIAAIFRKRFLLLYVVVLLVFSVLLGLLLL